MICHLHSTMHWRQTVNLSINSPSPTFPTASTTPQNTNRCSGNVWEKNSYNQRITETNRGKTYQFEENPISKRLVRVSAYLGRMMTQDPRTLQSAVTVSITSQSLAEASPCRVYSTVNEHLPASLFSMIHTPHKHRLSHETCSAL